MTRRLCAIGVALIALAATVRVAGAQPLQRLTITSFTMHADTVNPKREEPFHLIVRVHVAQRVSALRDLTLPILAALEILGDENGVTESSSGTRYREVITVVAHRSGTIRIAPATLDAIDARDGRAKRYFSNSLTLQIGGSPLQPIRNAAHTLVAIAAIAMKIILGLLIALCVICVVLLGRRVRKRRPRAAPPAQPVVPQPEAPRDPRAEARDAYLVLRADPTRPHALLARSIVRSMVGASDDETLGDVMHRSAVAADSNLRGTLLALERAAFTYDADLSGAIADALVALEHLTHAG